MEKEGLLLDLSINISDMADLLHELADKLGNSYYHEEAVKLNNISFALYNDYCDYKEDQ